MNAIGMQQCIIIRHSKFQATMFIAYLFYCSSIEILLISFRRAEDPSHKFPDTVQQLVHTFIVCRVNLVCVDIHSQVGQLRKEKY